MAGCFLEQNTSFYVAHVHSAINEFQLESSLCDGPASVPDGMVLWFQVLLRHGIRFNLWSCNSFGFRTDPRLSVTLGRVPWRGRMSAYNVLMFPFWNLLRIHLVWISIILEFCSVKLLFVFSKCGGGEFREIRSSQLGSELTDKWILCFILFF